MIISSVLDDFFPNIDDENLFSDYEYDAITEENYEKRLRQSDFLILNPNVIPYKKNDNMMIWRLYTYQRSSVSVFKEVVSYIKVNGYKDINFIFRNPYQNHIIHIGALNCTYINKIKDSISNDFYSLKLEKCTKKAAEEITLLIGNFAALKKNKIISINIYPYTNCLAQIVSIDFNKKKVLVKTMPILNYDKLDEMNIPSMELLLRKDPKFLGNRVLFDPLRLQAEHVKASTYNGHQISVQKWDGNIYFNGFILLEVDFDKISSDIGSADPSEINMFKRKKRSYFSKSKQKYIQNRQNDEKITNQKYQSYEKHRSQREEIRSPSSNYSRNSHSHSSLRSNGGSSSSGSEKGGYEYEYVDYYYEEEEDYYYSEEPYSDNDRKSSKTSQGKNLAPKKANPKTDQQKIKIQNEGSKKAQDETKKIRKELLDQGNNKKKAQLNEQQQKQRLESTKKVTSEEIPEYEYEYEYYDYGSGYEYAYDYGSGYEYQYEYDDDIKAGLNAPQKVKSQLVPHKEKTRDRLSKEKKPTEEKTKKQRKSAVEKPKKQRKPRAKPAELAAVEEALRERERAVRYEAGRKRREEIDAMERASEESRRLALEKERQQKELIEQRRQQAAKDAQRRLEMEEERKRKELEEKQRHEEELKKKQRELAEAQLAKINAQLEKLKKKEAKHKEALEATSKPIPPSSPPIPSPNEEELPIPTNDDQPDKAIQEPPVKYEVDDTVRLVSMGLSGMYATVVEDNGVQEDRLRIELLPRPIVVGAARHMTEEEQQMVVGSIGEQQLPPIGHNNGDMTEFRDTHELHSIRIDVNLPPKQIFDDSFLFRKYDIIVDQAGNFAAYLGKIGAMMRLLSTDNNIIMSPHYAALKAAPSSNDVTDARGVRIMIGDKANVYMAPAISIRNGTINGVFQGMVLIDNNDEELFWVESSEVYLCDPMPTDKMTNQWVNFMFRGKITRSYPVIYSDESGFIRVNVEGVARELRLDNIGKLWNFGPPYSPDQKNLERAPGPENPATADKKNSKKEEKEEEENSLLKERPREEEADIAQTESEYPETIDPVEFLHQLEDYKRKLEEYQKQLEEGNFSSEEIEKCRKQAQEYQEQINTVQEAIASSAIQQTEEFQKQLMEIQMHNSMMYPDFTADQQMMDQAAMAAQQMMDPMAYGAPYPPMYVPQYPAADPYADFYHDPYANIGPYGMEQLPLHEHLQMHELDSEHNEPLKIPLSKRVVDKGNPYAQYQQHKPIVDNEPFEIPLPKRASDKGNPYAQYQQQAKAIVDEEPLKIPLPKKASDKRNPYEQYQKKPDAGEKMEAGKEGDEEEEKEEIFNPDGLPHGLESILVEVPKLGSQAIVTSINRQGIVSFQLYVDGMMQFKTHKMKSTQVVPIRPNVGDLTLCWNGDRVVRGKTYRAGDEYTVMLDSGESGRFESKWVYKVYEWDEA